jgi:hypothetical protein
MRSDFVATISRVERGSIEVEQFSDESSAMKDLVGNWEGSAKGIGEILVDNMDYEQEADVLHHLMAGQDGDTLFEDIKESGYDLEGDEVKRLVDLLLDEMDDDTKATLLQEKGFFKREVPE